jgi:hypothetical protein
MADAAPGSLTDLLAGTRRVALVGLAKNTGKTETLAAILRELAERETCVGVTSIGRDGEARDVIDARIEKPRIVLQAGSLVASTDALVRASGLAHERLAQTGVRTPLGEVVVARLIEGGAVEVAGPSTAESLREVSDAMLSYGSEIVLIDGSIDRRAASSPAVADGLVIATGAVLSGDIEEVVARTRAAVALVQLPSVSGDRPDGRRLHELADTQDSGVNLMVDENLRAHPMPPRLVLTAEPPVIEGLLQEGIAPKWLLVSGALPEAFLNGLVPFARRTGQTLTIVVSDPTKVFLPARGVDFYARQGIQIETLHPISLRAITVNPLAPQSHRFHSGQLRELIGAAVGDVPVLDVLDPSYRPASDSPVSAP